MNNNKTKLPDLIVFVGFIFIIGFVSFLSLSKVDLLALKQSTKCFSEVKKDQNKEIEEKYKESIAFRNEFIDLYGIFNNVLNKNIIGNFEFIKDNKNMMHQINTNQTTEAFAENLILLNEQLTEKSIPLLYVQIPSRDDTKSFPFPIEYIDNTGSVIKDLFEQLDKKKVNYIDVGAKLKEDNFLYQKFFFNTDLHLTTEGEFYLLNIIAEYLNENLNIEVKNIDQINDNNKYNIIQHRFLDNLGRSSGRYYAGMDTFNTYIPQFFTDMSLEIPGQGIIRRGSFEDTVMNGYSNQNVDDYTYWVTDYLQFTTPYYRITNNIVSGPNLLFIMDSMCMRAVSYLSLGTSSITIMDPRFFNGTTYLSKVLNENYDAVIVCHENSLFFEMFPELSQSTMEAKFDAQIVEMAPLHPIELNEKINIEISVTNTGEYSWSEKDQIRLCVFQDGIDYGYRIPITDGVQVNPGETYTFILYDFRVSNKKDTYLEYQMVEEGIQWFGEKKRVEISVIDK